MSSIPTVSFITLGCAKNEVDSDKMRARLHAAGFIELIDPVQADFVIVNTCSFITEATEEAIATILEVLDLPSFTEGTAKLVVTGCLPARYGTDLATEFPEVAAFVSCPDEDNIATILHDLTNREDANSSVTPSDFAEPTVILPKTPVSPSDLAEPTSVILPKSPVTLSAAKGLAADTRVVTDVAVQSIAPIAPTPKTRTITAPWAYVKIADGCDRRCSFCTIPNIRGHYRSVPSNEIIAEAGELVGGGVREIILIAQDTGLWSQKTEPKNLAGLLDALAQRFPKTWFRIMYLQPQGITDELLATMAKHENICNYLDIPLQHASARVLKDMNRRGSGEEYLALLARIRQALPDVALRTTIIAGFPGETRAEAKELERFIEAAAFDYVGVFTYSLEDGTPAGLREDQIPLRTRKARAQRLRDLADSIGFARVASRIDTTDEVLITDLDEDSRSLTPLGRTKRQAPEVDGMIHLESGCIGEIVSATMIETYCYELDAQATGAHNV
jgi:ribosomal protein S12 methylthiotransferase